MGKLIKYLGTIGAIVTSVGLMGIVGTLSSTDSSGILIACLIAVVGSLITIYAVMKSEVS